MAVRTTRWVLRLRRVPPCLAVVPLVGSSRCAAPWLLPGFAARTHIKLWNCQFGNPASELPVALAALRDAGVAAISFFKHPGHALLSQPLPAAALDGYTALVDLDLSRAILAGDCAELWQLTQLERLQLRAPPSATFGAQSGQMSRLARLQSLTLRGPAIIAAEPLLGLSLPTSLTRLSMVCYNMRGSWQHLRPLQQLLSLFSCGLLEVPEALSSLQSLTHLLLDGNDLRSGSGWQHVQRLQHLRHLSARSCQLEVVPQQLSALLELTFLDLGFNERMEEGYEHLGQLAQLQQLILDSCAPEEVPASLAALTALTHLDCSMPTAGLLDGGWEHLRPLGGRLRELDLGASLEEVPQGLSHLTALT